MSITDWDDAYANGAYIPEADAILAAWPGRSEALCARFPPERRAYGTHERQVTQVFWSGAAPLGLVVIVHGGYWLRFSAEDFAFLAQGALERGYAVAMPSYRLAPEVDVGTITQDVRAAVVDVAGQVDGPIYLAGHSAGGHLVTRLACRGALPGEVAGRIGRVVSISGLHDLRPLMRTEMAEPLHLSEDLARAESPLFHEPIAGLSLVCAVGSAERPEFLRQNDLLVNAWTGLGADARSVHLSGDNHFTIIDGLCAPDGPLTKLMLD